LGNVDIRVINGLERIAVGDTRPDLTLILDLPPEIGLARATLRRGQEEPDRFEAEALDFHGRLREAYRAIAAQHPRRCMVVDACGDPEQIADAIWRVVCARFEEAAPDMRRAVAAL
jgi:dTMP kinase